MKHQLIETHNGIIQVSDFETQAELLAHKQMRMEANPEAVFEERNIEQQSINAEALKYLADTDWLIIREVDAGIPCPVEIKDLRAEARLKIVR